MSLVLAGVGSESDLTAVGSLLRQGLSSINLFTAADKRVELKARWEAAIKVLVEAAEPESDHQLAFVRAYASAASTPAFISTLLDGGLPGLTVDSDLRWTLLTALSRIGAAEDCVVAAELARDTTISGQEHAAAARAIRPNASDKENAWESVVNRTDVPNETRRSIALAFQVSGQGEVLEPYIDKYLDMAETVLEEKGVWMARVALEYLFPLANPSEETLAKVDNWLAATGAGAATRRYVSEGRDDLARALRAQKAH